MAEKKWWLPKQEGSTMANIKGFMGPLGNADPAKGSKKRKSKEKEMGNLYSEDFATSVAMNIMRQKEAVKKRPDGQWAVFDDETGAQKSGAFQKRSDAWKTQRQQKQAQQGADVAKRAEKQRQRQSLTPDSDTHKAKKEKDKPQLARHVAKKEKDQPQKAKAPVTAKSARLAKQKKKKMESIKNIFRQVLREASMVSYIFENEPQEGSIWENFMNKLAMETIMADIEMKKILHRGTQAEAKMLSRAVKTVSETLGATGAFAVKPGKMERSDSGARMNFEVAMLESGKNLGFSVGIQNSKPLIIFPEESRALINAMASHESKLLRAELMHVQETALDLMDDVIKATKARDNYLSMMERKCHKALNEMGPLQIAMLKHLLRREYKGVR